MYNVQWSPGVTLEQIERQVIEAAFGFFRQNKTQTARALDIAVRTLEAKLEKYGKDDAESNAGLLEARKRREEFLKRQRGVPAGVVTYNGVEFGGAQETGGPVEAEAKPGNGSDAGVRMEPASDTSEESAMSMQVRKKVQGMPSPQTPADRSRKAR